MSAHSEQPRVRLRCRDRRVRSGGSGAGGALGRAGHRVAVFERYHEIYRLPRAVHLDHEIMRLLQSLGLADLLADQFIPVPDYQWFGADGELILRFEIQGLAPSGWEQDYMFFQPEFEQAIDRHACAEPASRSSVAGWPRVCVDLGDGSS